MGLGDKPHGPQIVCYKSTPFRGGFFVRYNAIAGAFVYRNNPELSAGIRGRKCVETGKIGCI